MDQVSTLSLALAHLYARCCACLLIHPYIPTCTQQDRRFKDKESVLLKKLKFPPEFDKRVDMRKVSMQVMRPWIVQKVVELLGFEDDVVVEYATGLLEDTENPVSTPRYRWGIAAGPLLAKASNRQ